jgi:hypothetical protein
MEKLHMVRRNRYTVTLLIAVCMGLTMILSGPAGASDDVPSTEGPEGTGVQVASWLLTVPYCAVKSAFAIAGSVVGGLGYAFSGGNTKTAESVWTTSVYGTYIIRPAHLRGEEPVRFLGQSDDSQDEPFTRASVPSEVPSEPLHHLESEPVNEQKRTSN